MRFSLRGAAAVVAATALLVGTSGVVGVPLASADSAPAIVTDQQDYAPGSVVTVSGSGWAGGETVHLTVDDNDGQTWHYAADPVADGSGAFVQQLTLPDWFVATYTAVATDGVGSTATTTFTDSNVQVQAMAGSTQVGGVSVLWTAYRETVCSGSTTSSGTAVTDAHAYVGTTGVGNTHVISLSAPTTITVGTELYTFHDWSGPAASTTSSFCVSGSAANGTIKESANYVDAGVAVKQQQSIDFPILADKTYGDPDFAVSATATSGLPVSFSASGPCTVSGSTVHLTGAGDCTITATQGGNASYYPATPVARSFTIAPASVTVTVTCPTSVTYDGTAQSPCTAAATSAGWTSPQTLAVSYTNNTNVGTATATASYAGDADHLPASGSATFAVVKALSTTTLTCPASVPYTGSAQTPCTATVTGAGGLSQSLTVYYTNNTDAGTATASASYPGDANHDASSSTTTFAISQASTTVTVSCPASATYTGSPLTPCTASVNGSDGMSQTLPVTYAHNTDAGTATASASYAGDGNHAASSGSATFLIEQATSTVTLTCPGSVVYSGSAQTPCTATVTGAGGLSQSLTVTYTGNTDAGTATASASYGGDTNHSGNTATTTFTIAKAPSTVTVTCPSNVTYDGTAQTPCTATVAGVGGLSQSLPVTYADNTDAGTATASATYAGDANHLDSSGSTTFTIDPAPTTTTVSCPTDVTYDGTAQTPCSATVTGTDGFTSTLAVTYTDNVNAGTATASAAYAGDGNHLASNDSKTFTIDQAPSTTTVTCPTHVTYDGTAQTPCSAVVTGAGALSQAVAVTYADNTDAGTATASASYPGDLNHLPSSGSSSFVIDRAPTTTTVTCPTGVTYTGTAQTPCSATVTGAGGLSQTLPVSYAGNVNAGTATASASYAGDANHLPSNGSATFTVRPAHLTVTPDNQGMTYGDAVPTLTYSITGYVNGQSYGPSSGVSGGPVCTTTATSSSPAGGYPITCTQGTLAASNYDFLFVPGTLTVTQRTATLGYTGNLFWSTGSTTATSAAVTLQGVVTPAPGGSVDLTKAPVVFELYKSTNTAMLTPDTTCTATVSSTGVATCGANLGLDNWTVVMHMPSNAYFTASDSDPVVLTVYQPATDKFATGGGWVTDPSSTVSSANRHGNFGFTVRYKSGTTPSGQAVYVFRGADGYDYVIKSNSWQGGGLSFGTNTASFSGKCNVAVIDPATGSAVAGLGGGNFTFRVDATDNGSPGSGDTYAISVYTPTGTLYHQAGTTSSQLVLGGGNVTVHTTTK